MYSRSTHSAGIKITVDAELAMLKDTLWAKQALQLQSIEKIHPKIPKYNARYKQAIIRPKIVT